MDKKKLIEIAVRIYALYLLIQIPIALWAIVSVFAVDTSQFVINPFLYKTWAVISPSSIFSNCDGSFLKSQKYFSIYYWKT